MRFLAAFFVLACVAVVASARRHTLQSSLSSSSRLQTKVRIGEATTAFLDGLKAGKKCYNSYQATPAQQRNTKDWALFSRIMKPVLQQIQDNSGNVASWKDVLALIKTETGKEKWKAFDVRMGEATTEFLNWVSTLRKPTAIDGIENDIPTYFIQFGSTVKPSGCAKRMRVSFSIDETLSDNDRWKELARIMTSVIVSGGNSQYLTRWVWGKIETPEMMRVDPLLLQFCYSDWASAKAIFDEINQKLSALRPAFQTARTAYPAMQGRIGFLSFADYTKGTSFGADICAAYGKALTDNGNDANRAVTAFKAKWERDIGPIENYNNLVPDASVFTM